MVGEQEVTGKPSMRIMTRMMRSLPRELNGIVLGIIFQFTLD